MYLSIVVFVYLSYFFRVCCLNAANQVKTLQKMEGKDITDVTIQYNGDDDDDDNDVLDNDDDDNADDDNDEDAGGGIKLKG